MENAREVFTSTFEETTFQFLNEMEKDLKDYDGLGYYIGHCDFNGAINGSFEMIIHESMIDEYLNFLFCDESQMTITLELRSDSVKELANVLCGNMISKCVNAQSSEYLIEKPLFKALSSLNDIPNMDQYSFFEGKGKVCGFSFQVK